MIFIFFHCVHCDNFTWLLSTSQDMIHFAILFCTIVFYLYFVMPNYAKACMCVCVCVCERVCVVCGGCVGIPIAYFIVK